MTSRELTLNAIKGLPHPRVPVAQHNFTFCVKHCKITMDQFRKSPKLAAKAFYDTWQDFGYDCIIIDFDTCTLAEAMGSMLEFPEHEPARVKKFFLDSIHDISKLKVPDPNKDGRMPMWLETTCELRALVGNRAAIMGRADQGPFGLLFLLRKSEDLMVDLLTEDEQVIKAALEICTEAGVRFAKAQLAAGADMTSIGDSAAGESLISPELYKKFSQPYEKKYKKMLGCGLLSLHICGKTDNIIGGMIATGCDILELDHCNNIEKSLEVVNSRSCIFGNIDPSSVITFGSPELVTAECRKVLEAAVKKTRKFVLCPGCLVNSNAPDANMLAMTQATKDFGQYPQG